MADNFSLCDAFFSNDIPFASKIVAYRRVGLMIFFLTFVSYLSYAQENNIENNLTNNIDQLIAKAKTNMTKPDSLYYYSEKALQLAKDINYQEGEAAALKYLGIHAHLKGDFNQAIKFYETSLNNYKQVKNELEIGKLNLNIATSHNSKADYVKTITYALEALKSFKKTKDLNGEGRVLNLLGIVSYIQKNYRDALSYFKQYNALVSQVKDNKEIGSSYNNMGSTYEQLNLADSAIISYKKALFYKSKNASKTDLGTIHQNIGHLYQTRKQYNQALNYHIKSNEAYEAEGSKKWMSHSYFNIGLTYALLKDTVAAKKWLNKALTLAKQVEEKEILTKTYEQLAKLAITDDDGSYRKAYENLQLSVSQRDSILDKDKIDIIQNLKIAYETEKKEQKIKDLHLQSKIKDLEIDRKNGLILFSIILIVLLLSSTWLYINRRKIKNKIILQREIMKQQDIATQSVLEAEERERRRIATDLHDGVGQTLSAALMNLNGLTANIKEILTPDKIILEKSLALVNESYDEVRTISHQMMPNALLKAGLTAAVREFLSKIDEKQLKITLDISGFAKKLDDKLETVLYRVIQESVNNVIKHAQASKLSIQMRKDEDGIFLAIEDNGVGFHPSQRKEGIGLKNIKSRILFIQGSVEYDSAPGKGTLVHIFIPA